MIESIAHRLKMLGLDLLSSKGVGRIRITTIVVDREKGTVIGAYSERKTLRPVRKDRKLCPSYSILH